MYEAALLPLRIQKQPDIDLRKSKADLEIATALFNESFALAPPPKRFGTQGVTFDAAVIEVQKYLRAHYVEVPSLEEIYEHVLSRRNEKAGVLLYPQNQKLRWVLQCQSTLSLWQRGGCAQPGV